MRFILIPYKMGSAAAKSIKEAFIEAGHKCLRIDRADWHPKNTDRIIYYGGNLQLHSHLGHSIYNADRSIAQNKLTAFRAFERAGLSTVPWTNDPQVARNWNGKVVCRNTLTGHSGQGIEIWDSNEAQNPPFPETAPLYTQYIKKTYECRIHIFNGRMIDAQIKRKVRDADNNDPLIRNIHTGWVYCREDFTADQRAIDLAIQAVATCNLDFGAVDIIYNQHYNQFYLLEVNTAPGITGTTLSNYINAFIEDI
jgi:hypothetical protein